MEICSVCKLAHPVGGSHFEALAEALRKLVLAVGTIGSCRGCGVAIFWIRHKNGKQVPYTPAGLNHFIDCSVGSEFKKKAGL